MPHLLRHMTSVAVTLNIVCRSVYCSISVLNIVGVIMSYRSRHVSPKDFDVPYSKLMNHDHTIFSPYLSDIYRLLGVTCEKLYQIICPAFD